MLTDFGIGGGSRATVRTCLGAPSEVAAAASRDGRQEAQEQGVIPTCDGLAFTTLIE